MSNAKINSYKYFSRGVCFFFKKVSKKCSKCSKCSKCMKNIGKSMAHFIEFATLKCSKIGLSALT